MNNKKKTPPVPTLRNMILVLQMALQESYKGTKGQIRNFEEGSPLGIDKQHTLYSKGAKFPCTPKNKVFTENPAIKAIVAELDNQGYKVTLASRLINDVTLFKGHLGGDYKIVVRPKTMDEQTHQPSAISQNSGTW